MNCRNRDKFSHVNVIGTTASTPYRVERQRRALPRGSPYPSLCPASQSLFGSHRKRRPDDNGVGEDRKRGQTKPKIRTTSAKSIAIFSSAFMPTFRVAEQDSNRDHAEE